MRIFGVLLALLSAASFAGSNVLIRRGQEPGKADRALFATLLMNVCFLLPFALGRGLVITWSGGVGLAFGWFVAAGLLNSLAGRGFLIASIRRVGAVRASIASQTAPLITMTIGITVLGESISGIGVAGVVLIGSGILLLISEQQPYAAVRARMTAVTETTVPPATPTDNAFAPIRSTASSNVALTGLILAITSAVAFGTGQAARKQGFVFLSDPVVGAGVGALAGLIAYTAHAFIAGNVTSMGSLVRGMNRFFVASGASVAVAQVSFFAALTFAPVAYVAVIVATQALFIVLFGRLFLRRSETWGSRVLVATGLVFAGSVAIGVGG